jgi:hypothetical protein
MVINYIGTMQGWVCPKSLGQSQLRKMETSKDLSNRKSHLRSNSSLMSLLSDHVSHASRASRAACSSLTRAHGKKDLDLQLAPKPQIGDTLEADGRVIVREEESMISLKILTLKKGDRLRVLDYGKSNPNRMKVSVEGTIGWASILDKNLHQPLLGKRPHS